MKKFNIPSIMWSTICYSTNPMMQSSDLEYWAQKINANLNQRLNKAYAFIELSGRVEVLESKEIYWKIYQRKLIK